MANRRGSARPAHISNVVAPDMPNHYACHAGMLLYLSQQFRDAASAERDPRFGAYADMLDRIVGDLMGRDDAVPAARPMAAGAPAYRAVKRRGR